MKLKNLSMIKTYSNLLYGQKQKEYKKIEILLNSAFLPFSFFFFFFIIRSAVWFFICFGKAAFDIFFSSLIKDPGGKYSLPHSTFLFSLENPRIVPLLLGLQSFELF